MNSGKKIDKISTYSLNIRFELYVNKAFFIFEEPKKRTQCSNKVMTRQGFYSIYIHFVTLAHFYARYCKASLLSRRLGIYQTIELFHLINATFQFSKLPQALTLTKLFLIFLTKKNKNKNDITKATNSQKTTKNTPPYLNW